MYAYIARNGNVTQAYKDIFDDLHVAGISISPRNKPTLELPGLVVLHIEQGSTFPAVLVSKRRFNLWFALAECLWMWSGHRDVESIAKYNGGIKQFSDDGSIFHGAYGWRAVEHFSIDQIAWIIKTIKEDPYSRRLVLDIYDANMDCGVDSLDIPCNIAVMFRVRPNSSGKDVLDMTVIRRSNDFIWGLPYNLVQFWWLHNMIATSAGITTGSVHHVVSSMHLYTRDYGSGSNAVLQNNANWAIEPLSTPLTWDDVGATYDGTKALSEVILSSNWDKDIVDVSPLAFSKVKGGAPNLLYRVFDVRNQYMEVEGHTQPERVHGWLEGIPWDDVRFLLNDFIIYSKKK